MISKKKFVEIINRLKSYSELQDKINDLFKDNIDNKEMDFMNAGSICVGHETVVLDLLENMFDDYDMLKCWIYECEYGTAFGLGDLEIDGVQTDLSTAEKLYDYLVKCMKNNQKDDKKRLEKTADEMFEELEYTKQEGLRTIAYSSENDLIIFYKAFKGIEKRKVEDIDFFTMQELKAIIKKCEELCWI